MKKTMNVKEVAEALGVSLPKAYQLVHTKSFPTITLGGRILVPSQAFDEWLNQQVNKEQ